ncbi:MAG TPA: acylphosphatase [Candidatus Limnocylindrales bacterium]
MRDPGGTVRLDATIRGGVQGVGYRFFVLRVASRLEVTGWVANEPDGTVRCVAEGTRGELERLLSALREGPAAARVENVAASWSAASGGFGSFGVRARGHSGD